MKEKFMILALIAMCCGKIWAHQPTDTTTTGILQQDSAYIAQQTAEIERFLAEAYAHQMLDSIEASHAKTPRFSIRQAIMPTALIAVGTVAVWEHNLCKAKRYMHDQIEASHTHADDYIQWLPLAMNIGLQLGGVKSKYSRIDDLLATVTSMAFVYSVGTAMKYSIREPRPYDKSVRTSFPSMHTARAFRSAEMIRLRHGNWWGLGGYAIASTVAYLRLRNGKHWINDVVGGAGLGILSARIGYWLVPWEKKLLHIDSRSNRTKVAAMPYYDSENRGIGAIMAIQF